MEAVAPTRPQRGRTGGSEARAVTVPGDEGGFEYRFRRLEDSLDRLNKRVESIDEHGSRRVGVLESDLRHVSEQIDDLSGELRELRTDLRDTRHRLTSNEAAVASLTVVVAQNSKEVGGFRRSLIASALGVSTAVLVSSITLWLTFGGAG